MSDPDEPHRLEAGTSAPATAASTRPNDDHDGDDGTRLDRTPPDDIKPDLLLVNKDGGVDVSTMFDTLPSHRPVSASSSRSYLDPYPLTAAAEEHLLCRLSSLQDTKVGRIISRCHAWLKGPRPPRELKIRHYRWWPLGSVEARWMRLTRPIAGTSGGLLHWTLLFIVYVAWLIGVSVLVSKIWYNANTDVGPAQPIDCTATFWNRNEQCGLDGTLCAPLSNTSFPFRCPEGCRSVTLLNPRAVGDLSLNYVPLVVGGGDQLGTYRGDSFICAAAIHAGVYDGNRGGCGAVATTGTYSNFIGASKNGLDSIPFDSIFPSSFRFVDVDSELCQDRRWDVLAMNLVMTVLVSLLLRPKPIVYFWTLLCVGYWHVTFSSEPRTYPPDITGAIADFLPTLFVGYAIWRSAFRHVLPAFETFPLEKTALYLAGFWVGVLLNVTFGAIPIQTLTPRAIRQQPGGITAVIIGSIVVFLIALNQVRVIRKTGWLPYYLFWYITGGVVIGILCAIPTLVFRFHHYIAALALLPGTAFPTRLAGLYQGFLLGMFLNGVARWSYDGILETVAQVAGDATLGTDLPSFVTDAASWAKNVGQVAWNGIPANLTGSWDGFILLVDDVERYAGPLTSYSLQSLVTVFNSTLFASTAGPSLGPSANSSITQINIPFALPPSWGLLNTTLLEDLPHYFRLAYTLQGVAGDFTHAAKAFSNGTWIPPVDGPT